MLSLWLHSIVHGIFTACHVTARPGKEESSSNSSISERDVHNGLRCWQTSTSLTAAAPSTFEAAKWKQLHEHISMGSAVLHHARLLDLNADSTECCPVPGLRHVLAVGTYQLDEQTQQRTGRLYLYTLTNDNSSTSNNGHHSQRQHKENTDDPIDSKHAASSTDCDSSSQLRTWQLLPACETDMPGIFDLQWWPHSWTSCNNQPARSSSEQGDCMRSDDQPVAIIGGALADGSLRLFFVKNDSQQVRLQTSPECHTGEDARHPETCCLQCYTNRPVSEKVLYVNKTFEKYFKSCTKADSKQSLQCTEVASCKACDDGMVLSLDWQHQGNDGNQTPSFIATSSSSGTASVVQVRDGGLLKLLEWQAHELEVWCAAFSHAQPDIVYTGSDDCMFKAWDIREAADDTPAAVFSNRRTHSAGVCTISPHPTQHHVVATGSYDEYVRLWDMRMLHKPVTICEVKTGGGNWRLRWHPTNENLLLAACMYKGFAVLESGKGQSCISVVEEYDAHKSIAYGADWFCPGFIQDINAANIEHLSEGVDIEHVEWQTLASLVATCSFYDRLLHVWSPACCDT